MVPHLQQGPAAIFDVLKANDKNEHDAADIVCAECKSIIATLHAPDARRAGVRDKKVVKASEMAAQGIDRLIDPSAPDEAHVSAVDKAAQIKYQILQILR